MVKLPAVVGLLLCKNFAVDTQTAEVSLVGLVYSLRSPVFPTPVVPLTAYSLLYDGAGEGTMELSIQQLETEQEIFRKTRWFAFAERGRFTEFEMRLKKCIFPAPGRYGVALRFDGRDLAWRLLNLYEGKR
jgi:hypothetical protein